ncbi:MAG TPA: fructosamine kinase family protein, partial [Acidimicrobiales bacterium]|nr:fructosamine kinase family protein [Acidimicrobiales bacterium]
MSSAMWRLNAAGIPVVAKRGPSITDEADGLRLLASVAGGPGVPKILYENEDLLVIEWIEPSRQSPGHEDRLGRELAALHAVVAPCWGSGSSWVGQCPIDPICYGDGPDFYRARLVELARRCGLEEQVATLAEKITDLVPFDSPSHLHGDLWWGNIIWGTGE